MTISPHSYRNYYDWLAPKLSSEERKALDVIYEAANSSSGPLDKELAALREFHREVMSCAEDTWECERCGNSEPWWTESNADYLTRGTLKSLSNATLDREKLYRQWGKDDVR